MAITFFGSIFGSSISSSRLSPSPLDAPCGKICEEQQCTKLAHVNYSAKVLISPFDP
jgi:hypothetical protein